MGFLAALTGAGGAISSLFSGVTGLVDKVTTTDEERLKAQLEVKRLETAFTLEMAKLEVENAKTQASVITAEVHSTSWMARSWRPILMLTFTFIIAYNHVIAPIFSLTALPLPPEMWATLKLGMGGYIVSRSAEKIAPGVVAAVVDRAGKKYGSKK